MKNSERMQKIFDVRVYSKYSKDIQNYLSSPVSEKEYAHDYNTQEFYLPLKSETKLAQMIHNPSIFKKLIIRTE